MSITPRDQLEIMYISDRINDVPFRDAKAFVEERRDGVIYSDEDIQHCWERELMGVEWRHG